MTKLPFISCICVTFCRVRHLEEAIACFLKQDYQGERELIIYNTCVEQKLVFNHPLVKIINAETRPTTLGETRNKAIEHASGDLMVTHDDDNITLPGHLSNFVRNGFDPEVYSWVRQDRQIYVEGPACRGVTHVSADLFAFTKKAWQEVGGYTAMGSGEDRNFLSKVSSQFDGQTVQLQNNEITYLYVWGQGDSVYHASGNGDDRPNHPTLFERSGKWAQERLAAMLEPSGEVVLKPQLHRDWEGMARNFVGAVKHLEEGRRGKIGVLVLGHSGDILNILPVCRYIAQRWAPPTFFTSVMYGAVLNGVSYVNPVYLDLPDRDINKAIEIAKQRVEVLLVCQVHGENFQVERMSGSYNEDAWRMAGMLEHFHDLTGFPLIIDRRDLNREARLAETLPLAGQPVMLVNVTGGLSSPWHDGRRMLEWLQKTFQSHFNVVDLAQVRAERIYDVLGLLDRAAILITSDTYTVHLAAASTVPVVAILNDNTQPFGKPWLRSKPRYDTLLTLNYSEAMSHCKSIHGAVMFGAGLRRIL